jgi:hypothetical protein
LTTNGIVKNSDIDKMRDRQKTYRQTKKTEIKTGGKKTDKT